MIPGEYKLKEGDIELCAGRERISVEVANTGDRPIQIGSHYHFAEANPALVFDRDKPEAFAWTWPQARRFALSPARPVKSR